MGGAAPPLIPAGSTCERNLFQSLAEEIFDEYQIPRLSKPRQIVAPWTLSLSFL